VGAGPELHRLRDLLLLWSNFPLRSTELDIVGPQGDLGRVPGTNLLLLRPGAVFVLGRDRLRVDSVGRGRFLVTPTRDPVTTRIRYGGLPPALDPGLVDEVRRYIVEESQFGHLDQPTEQRRLIDMVAPLRRILSDAGVPRCDTLGGHLYATFGGVRLNRVLARRFGGNPDDADEVFVSVPSSIDLAALPQDAEELVDHSVASDVEADLTLYQQYLPAELLALEAEAQFVAHPRTQLVLDRLRHSTAVDVAWPDIRPLRLGTKPSRNEHARSSRGR
jgi:hypothetical protein